MSGYKYSSEHNTDLDNVYETGTNTRTTGFLINGVDIGTRYKPYSYGYNKHINLTESSNANDSIYTYNSTNINTFFQLKDSNYFTVTNGTRIANDTYNYVYKFTTDGTVKFNNNTKIYIDAVGGGGGGGCSIEAITSSAFEGGGGGGGGGRWSGHFYCLANTTYTISIGAGGTSYFLYKTDTNGHSSRNGENGGDTKLKVGSETIMIAKGGGGGGNSRIKVGKTGGCGGGSCGYAGTSVGGSNTSSTSVSRTSQTINYVNVNKPVNIGNITQTGFSDMVSIGNDGGAGTNRKGGGGGGGIATAGSASTSVTGGSGGAGSAIFGYPCGGGGGGGGGSGNSGSGGIAGAGGYGGGGNGEANQSWAQHGTDGTGGGGGGCSNNGNVGGMGGSGILFIAF